MGARLECGRVALLGCVAALAASTVGAQEGVIELPDVSVSASRLVTRAPRTAAPERAPARPTASPAAAADRAGEPKVEAPSGILTGTLVTGASSTVITSREIDRSPGITLQEVLSREPGVQVTNLFGGVNGARSTVDLRGFGAAAAPNTLVLVNGRRITDLDLVGVDLASIPRESIERVEVTRGNSGTVLYGDGAVGGVINIVTKTGVGLPAKARVDAAFGSFRYREGNASASGSNGPWAASVYTNAINSDGYRINNFYRQLAGVGDFRYATEEGGAYLTLSADNSYLGLPGARLVDPSIGVDQLVSDRRGATTPFDYAVKRGQNATAGVTRMLMPGLELIVDGGIRSKQESAEYHGGTDPSSSQPLRAVDTRLTTTSFTPRLRVDTLVAGVPFKALGGVDYLRAQYDSERPLLLGAPPIHRYDLTQTSLGAYWQQTVSVLPSTDLGAGIRIQNTAIRARDRFDADAPGGSFCFPPFGCFPADVEGIPLDRSENNRAYHLGFEHRFNPVLAVFGRHARSFRVPNVDERVGMVTAGGPEPTNFNLRTQRSHDWELGLRVRNAGLELQWSAYDMYLVDEIHFRFAPGFVASNINLDPTRRYGHETIVGYRLDERVRFKGGLAYTRAVFREGPFAGNDIPLVSRWTGSVGVAWDIQPKRLSFDGVVRYIGERRMDNDQRNLQPLVPAHAVVDVGLSGEIDRYYWSFKIQNLLDTDYFDYAIASPFPDGPGSRLNRFNAYPQPGRAFVFKAGATF